MAIKEHPIIRALKGDRKVVINNQHGGFNLSDRAIERYLEIRGIAAWPETKKTYGVDMTTWWLVAPDKRIAEPSADEWSEMSQSDRARHNRLYRHQVFTDRELDRDDPVLVQVIEELGAAANGRYCNLKIVEIPWDVEWEIAEYDGAEWVAEKHRTWS
jgi:hypothetical protein